MIDLNYITVGDPDDFMASVGFKEWTWRQERRAGQPGSPIERKPRLVQGVVGARLFILRRDLESREMETGAARPLAPSSVVSLHPASDCHFYAQASLDGRQVLMMIDTGSSFCSLTEEAAERVGIRLQSSRFTQQLSTQNGPIKVVPMHR